MNTQHTLLHFITRHGAELRQLCVDGFVSQFTVYIALSIWNALSGGVLVQAVSYSICLVLAITFGIGVIGVDRLLLKRR